MIPTPKLRKRLSRVFVTLLIIFGSIFFGDVASYATSSTVGNTSTGFGWSWTHEPAINCVGTTTPHDPTWDTDNGFNDDMCMVAHSGTIASAASGDTDGSQWLTQFVYHCTNGTTVTGTTSNRNPSVDINLATNSTCGAVDGIKIQGAGSAHNVLLSAGVLTPSPAWCATSDFTDVAGSYVGTTLTVRFKWLNSTLPSAGWTVIGPDPGTSTGSSGTIPKSATVDGYPKYYFGSVTASTDAALTARIYTAANGSAPGCYTSLTLSTVAIGSMPTPGFGDTGSDTQTSTNTNCGWSLNPFHYLKCLFEPSHSLQQWNDLQSTASTHAPTSLVIGGVGYISDTFQVFSANGASNGDACHDGNYVNSCTAFHPPSFDASDGPGSADIFDQAGDDMQNTTWGNVIYSLESLGAAVTGFFLCWQLISRSIGGKEEVA